MKRPKELIHVDMFCGAGGATLGAHRAMARLKRSLKLRDVQIETVAINHWTLAVETHSANFPKSMHICNRVEAVSPREAVPGGVVHLLTAGPECTHHSKARGGKPKNDQSRASAWHIVHWCESLDVRSLIVENVEDFVTWGPLNVDGHPIEGTKGKTFLAWLNALESLGYRYEWRILNSANFGDPQTRERFFLVARKDGLPIQFPDPTYSESGERTLFGQMKKWRAVGEIVEWDVPGTSIFGRKRPLVVNTLKRITHGLRRFGGIAFALPNEGFHRGNAPRALSKPLNTVTAGRGAGSLVSPFIVSFKGTGESQLKSSHRAISSPSPTLTSAGSLALCDPYVLTLLGTSPSCLKYNNRSTRKPAPTVTGNGNMALVDSCVVQYHGGKDSKRRVYSTRKPLPTVDGSNRYGKADFVLSMRGGNDGYTRGVRTDQPAPTITSLSPTALVESSFVVTTNHGKDKTRSYSTRQPLKTVTGVDAFALAQSAVITNGVKGKRPALSSDEEAAWDALEAFIIREASKKKSKYPGVPIVLPDGRQGYLDLRMRMFTTRELARAQSFPDDYKFRGTNRDDVTKQIGNAWAGETAAALCKTVLQPFFE